MENTKQAETQAIWNREQRGVERGSRAYWQTVAHEGLPAEDYDAATCEGDNGYGPCGRHTDWGSGQCAEGHAIEFADND